MWNGLLISAPFMLCLSRHLPAEGGLRPALTGCDDGSFSQSTWARAAAQPSSLAQRGQLDETFVTVDSSVLTHSFPRGPALLLS